MAEDISDDLSLIADFIPIVAENLRTTFTKETSNSMKVIHEYVLGLLAAGFTTMATAGVVVLDQGPSTGTFGNSWVNIRAGQNFADNISFSRQISVTGYNYFSALNLTTRSGASAFHLRVWSDHSGVPGALIFENDIGFSGYTHAYYSDRYSSIDRYEFLFAPVTFNAGVTYWIGLAGNGFDAGMGAVLSPQDGRVAHFLGSHYFQMESIGDQMYQLTATSVPEPGTCALFVAGLAILCVAKRLCEQHPQSENCSAPSWKAESQCEA